jgi:hypothetical protein
MGVPILAFLHEASPTDRMGDNLSLAQKSLIGRSLWQVKQVLKWAIEAG